MPEQGGDDAPQHVGAQPASPYATGGGGVRFEHRVAAFYLARLLSGTVVPELDSRLLARVSFQQSSVSPVDDLLLTSGPNAAGRSIRLAMACRRSPSFVRSDEPTKKLFVSLVQADIAADDCSEIDNRIAIAISGHQGGANEVAELAVLARNQCDGPTYFAMVNEAGRFSAKLRSRLSHIKDLVGSALQSIGVSDVGLVQERCRSLLGRLSIVPLELETPDATDWAALVDVLTPWSAGGTTDSGIALRNELDALSGEFAQSSADVDANMLRRRLHSFIDPAAHRSSEGWARLLLLDRDAREAVPRTLFGAGSHTSLTLERIDMRAQLAAALHEAHGDLMVKGESGVGKSAAVLDAVEPSMLGEDEQALAINLRHMPDTPADLLAALSAPLEDMLAQMTAPRRLLIVDGAEAAVENKRDVFIHMLRAAHRSGVTVVAVAASEGASVAIQLMKTEGAVREFVVPSLSDDEISMVAAHFRELERLAADTKGRELLRRPIVIALLLQAGDPGIPLSDVDALEHIWNKLVRNGERQDAGFPDAREHVVLSLAAHALSQGAGDNLLAGLDHAAVAGLRDSGILRPRSVLPWERDPDFAHDLLRAYAVARQLLRTNDLGVELRRVGAPRWALPAARLASELLLSLPDIATDPAEGRFARLQAAFDDLVAAGHGERWADVPMEALLAIADPLPVLRDAWHTLLDNNAAGIRRLVRVVDLRHQRYGLLQAIVAEPVIIQLLNEGTPRGLEKDVADLIRDWLNAHVGRRTPAGQPTRVALAHAIAERCAENVRELDRKDAEARAARAARTSEEIAAAEEQQRFAALPVVGRRRRRRPTRRHWPYEWIDDSSIGHLALLGPDLGPSGEAILRRIAEDAPHSLAPAVETPLAGHALATFDAGLLMDLVEAYYLDVDHDDEDGFGYGGFHEDGIRGHTGGGFRTPLASYDRGPFLAMFRADYSRGVACLNRMLNHAARYRVRILSSRSYVSESDADTSGYEHVLSVNGTPRTYVGDSQVWLWYRGTGVGPYPFMSALQALEFVSDDFIRLGVPVTRLVPILLRDAESLAMPALVLGMLVRHLETAEDALDPFIVEPLVWHLEFARSMHDQSGILAAHVPGLQGLNRRTWNLGQVCMMLTLQAEGQRIEHIRQLGERLVTVAKAQVGDDTSPAARQHLAAVQNWAAALDRTAYQMTPQDDGRILIEQVANPEVEAVLGEVNSDIRRTNDALGLTNRHAHVRDNGGRAPDISAEALAADLAIAQDLLANPPNSGTGLWPDGIAATAASAIELHFARGTHVTDADLLWSTKVLLDVASEIAENPSDAFDDSLFSQGAGRSAARGIPHLLMPSALELRTALATDHAVGVEQLIALNRAVATGASNEARLAYARSLDVVWLAPCSAALHDRCHHHVAFELAEASYNDCVLGEWDSSLQQRTIARLDPPIAASLADVDAGSIIVRRLSPALRAYGAAAISDACCKQQAQEALDILLAAHRRTMLTYEHGYHHSHSDSLIAARAALWQAMDNRDSPVLEYVNGYLSNSRMLTEALQAINAAAEERPSAAAEARRLWPIIMDRVLDAETENLGGVFTGRDWGDALCELIPNPAPQWHYLALEIDGEPERWRDLLGWSTQINRWLGFAVGNRGCIDSLVIAVRELELADQLDTGLTWIERIVHGDGDGCARTFTLPEWLRERRADLTTPEQHAKWERIVDRLVVSGDTRIADLTD